MSVKMSVEIIFEEILINTVNFEPNLIKKRILLFNFYET